MARPRLYKSVEEMEERIDGYFAEDPHPTMAGMCSFLQICKQTMNNYEHREDGFAEIIRAARLRVEAEVERQLVYGKGGAGPIFWLKNNGGYVDKVEQTHSGPDGGPVLIERVIVKAADPNR